MSFRFNVWDLLRFVTYSLVYSCCTCLSAVSAASRVSACRLLVFSTPRSAIKDKLPFRHFQNSLNSQSHPTKENNYVFNYINSHHKQQLWLWLDCAVRHERRCRNEAINQTCSETSSSPSKHQNSNPSDPRNQKMVAFWNFFRLSQSTCVLWYVESRFGRKKRAFRGACQECWVFPLAAPCLCNLAKQASEVPRYNSLVFNVRKHFTRPAGVAPLIQPRSF